MSILGWTNEGVHPYIPKEFMTVLLYHLHPPPYRLCWRR